MGQLEDLSLFVAVVEAGSLTKAAREQNIAKSAVSRRLALLEDRYGKVLIDRRPGHWALSEHGEQLYARARVLVRDARALQSEFLSGERDLKGELNLSLPRDFGLSFLAQCLSAFASLYPDIHLRVNFEDRFVDLWQENYDALVRIAKAPPAALQSEVLGSTTVGLYASPDYLRTAPALLSLHDLSQHRYLSYAGTRLVGGIPDDEFQVRPVLSSNSGLYLREAALSGLGLAELPDCLIFEEVPKGRLVRVLPAAISRDLGIYLCTRDTAHRSKRVMVFSSHLRTAFAEATASLRSIVKRV